MSGTAQTAAARTLSFDSQLIEDFLHTQDILVDGTCAEPLTVFLNQQGNSESLVICPNSQGNDELYHVYREPLSDSGWNVYGLGACPTGIAVSNSDTLWAVGTDLQFWRNRTGRWNQNVSRLPGGALPMPPNATGSPASVPVSVGLDETVWAIDAEGKLYVYDDSLNDGAGGWQSVNCPYPLSAAPAGSSGNFWAISGTQLVQFAEGSWQAWPVGWLPQQVCVGNDGTVWALDNQGNLYQYSNQQWQQMAGAQNLVMMAVVSASQIWGIMLGQSYALWNYDGSTWQPASQAPPIGSYAFPGPIPQISSSVDGTVWCVDTSGVSWKYVPSRAQSWQRQMMPTGMSGFTATGGVTQVVVGNDKTGAQAFYILAGTLHRATSTTGGTWRKIGQVDPQGCSSVEVTHQQDTGEMIAYAVFSDGNLALAFESAGYQTTNINANGTLKGARVQISAMNASQWFTASVMDQQLYVQWGTAANPLASGPYPGQMIPVTGTPGGGSAPTNLTQLLHLPWVQSPIGFYCAVLDSAGNVSVVFNLNFVEYSSDNFFGIGSFIPLTGDQSLIPSPLTAISCASALIDASGLTRIYATDSNQQLWLIRQAGLTNDPTNDNPWTWTSWHPLGNNCRYLSHGPGINRTRELFTLDGDNFLNRLSQDPVSTNWSADQLRKPTGTTDDPCYVTQYVTEITVYDQNDNPESNVAVTISVAQPVSVWVSGTQYDLDAATPAKVRTNVMGKITLSTLALGLHTAQLTFQADGFAQPYAVYPPQNIQQRLAQVDGPTLQNAQSRTQSVPVAINVPLVAPAQQSNCTTVAAVMQHVLQIKASNKINPGAPGLVSAGTVVSVNSASSDTNAVERLSSWDSFWDDLAHFGEDVWHGIRHGVLILEDFVVLDLKQGLIQLTLTLEAVGQAVIQFVVETIDDVVLAVSSAFRWIGAKVEQAIDWLKEFFSWGDILNTKRVIEYYLNQVLGNLVNNLDPDSPNNVEQLVQAQFQNLLNLITGGSHSGSDAFSRAQATFGSTSFNGTVVNTPVDPRVQSHGLDPKGVTTTYQAHQVKSNYARSKGETFIHQGGKIGPSGGGASQFLGAGPFSDFLTLIENTLGTGTSFDTAQESFRGNLQKMQNPRGLFDTAINDFLSLLKDLAKALVEVVEQIVVGLLQIAGQGVAGFQSMLNFPLHIPVISWLYQKISDHPLTLLDLYCLVMAIPTTLIYKLIWGGENASPPFTKAQVEGITSRSITWPQIEGSGIGISSVPLTAPSGLEASTLSFYLGLLSLINGVAYGVIDVATDADSLAGGESDISAFLSGSALVFSIASFGFTVPYPVFEKEPDARTQADILNAVVWGTSALSLLLNLASFVSGQNKRLAKYLTVGPQAVAAVGLVQILAGIIAAIEFSQADSGYNGFCSAGAIITPIPSIAKLALLSKSADALFALGPIDLICDVGSGLCTLAGDIA